LFVFYNKPTPVFLTGQEFDKSSNIKLSFIKKIIVFQTNNWEVEDEWTRE
jgi:hypothetical protein